jgi:hypothetical protein
MPGCDRLPPEMFKDIWQTLHPLGHLVQRVGFVALDEIVDHAGITHNGFCEDVELATPLLDAADVLLAREQLCELEGAGWFTPEEQADNPKPEIVRPSDRDGRIDQFRHRGAQPLADCRLADSLWLDHVVDPLADRILREMTGVSSECEELHREVSALRGTAVAPSWHFLIISEEMVSLSLTPDALLPLLVTIEGTEFLPAPLWPLDLALVALAREVEPDSEIAGAFGRVPRASRPDGQQFVGLRQMIHRLVERGWLIPGGTGWDAGYSVASQMRKEGEEILGALRLSDRAALRVAAQVLSDAVRMLSKNAAASRPRGSATI